MDFYVLQVGERVDDIFTAWTRRAYALIHIMQRFIKGETSRILRMVPVNHIGDGRYQFARRSQSDLHLALEIDIADLFPLAQVSEHVLPRSFRDLKSEALAGAALIQRQHKPWSLLRAAVMIGEQAKRTVVALHHRQILRNKFKARVPHEGPIAKDPAPLHNTLIPKSRRNRQSVSEETGVVEKRRSWLKWLLLFGALWLVLWLAGHAFLVNQVIQLRKNLAANGMALSCEQEKWGGFPLRYTLSCSKPRLTPIAAGAEPQASAERLDLAMWFPYPLAVSATLEGPTQIGKDVISHRPAPGRVTFTLTGGLTLQVTAAEFKWPGNVEAKTVTVSASRGSDLAKLGFSAEGLSLQNLESPITLEQVSGSAETDARVLDAEQPLALMAAENIPLTITDLHARTGTAEIKGSGQLTLDQAHKLNGKLASEIEDIDALMAFLAPPLKLTEGEVAGAKTVIALLGGDPNSAQRKLDIIAKAGEIYFGPFKIADVPPLED